MPDGSPRTEIETLRSHICLAEIEIVELRRQIAERERFNIPTIGLEAALNEQIAARNTLEARLQQAAGF